MRSLTLILFLLFTACTDDGGDDTGPDADMMSEDGGPPDADPNVLPSCAEIGCLGGMFVVCDADGCVCHATEPDPPAPCRDEAPSCNVMCDPDARVVCDAVPSDPAPRYGSCQCQLTASVWRQCAIDSCPTITPGDARCSQCATGAVECTDDGACTCPSGAACELDMCEAAP